MGSNRNPGRAAERGSVLPIVMVLAAASAVVLSSFLGRTLMEQHRTNNQAALERASWRARGQLEMAKNFIDNSTYTGGQNDLIALALAAKPPIIPDTTVLVETAGPSRWYRLTAVSEYSGQVGMVMAYLRDGTSFVAYNYYVENDDLGVSGQPDGRIHTNGKLEFHYEGGRFNGHVSSSEGFEFLNGATPENTLFLGGANEAADPKSLLQQIDFDKLKSESIFVAPEGLDARVEFQGENTQVQLYEKPVTISIPLETEVQTYQGSVYREVTRPRYRTEYQWVDVQKSRKKWVSGSGGALGAVLGGASALVGSWRTEYYTEREYLQVRIPDGTYTQWEWVPVFASETITDLTETPTVGALVSQQTFPSQGVFYFPELIKSVAGDLNGKVTLVTEGTARIANHIRYVDGEGLTAYLNGTNPALDYVPNPDFRRDHALGIIAQGNVEYARNAPSHLEINATLISTQGSVGFEGVQLDAFGRPFCVGTPVIRESLRRYGSIMSYRRPVSVLLDDSGEPIHGFRTGDSIFDRNLALTPPAGLPFEQKVMYLPDMRIDHANVMPPGAGVWEPGLTALPDPLRPEQILSFTRSLDFDWGVLDLTLPLGPIITISEGNLNVTKTIRTKVELLTR